MGENPENALGVENIELEPASASEASIEPAIAASAGSSAAPAAAPARRFSYRFALVAGGLAIAAGLGSVLGSLAASGFLRPSPPATLASTGEAGEGSKGTKLQLTEFSALKAELDGATRSANAQLAKISERLDRIERAQSNPSAQLSHIADTLDRLDKRGAAAPETTGSIAPATPSSAPLPPAEAKPPLLENWIVEGVHGNRAMVTNRYGAEFIVGAGSMLPGIGRVQAVKKQDGQWIVLTERGLISSNP